MLAEPTNATTPALCGAAYDSRRVSPTTASARLLAGFFLRGKKWRVCIQSIAGGVSKKMKTASIRSPFKYKTQILTDLCRCPAGNASDVTKQRPLNGESGLIMNQHCINKIAFSPLHTTIKTVRAILISVICSLSLEACVTEEHHCATLQSGSTELKAGDPTITPSFSDVTSWAEPQKSTINYTYHPTCKAYGVKDSQASARSQ